mgnify:CR=1 FL=1
MKWALLPVVALVGCSSTSTPQMTYPNQKLVIDGEVSAMSRNEVISAIQDCQDNDLRPVLIHAKRRVEGRITDVVIDITCAPRKRRINKENT